MKKMFFMAAVAALALSSCSSDDLVQAPEVNGAEDGAVSFSAYAGRANRATLVEDADKLAYAGGFGVYAYDQGDVAWATYNASNTQPNFFYNQQVKGYSATTISDANDLTGKNTGTVVAWAYSPVKYYNNNVNAKHSFFAYAPYKPDVKAVFMLGKAPQVRYAMGVDDYDLMWGAHYSDATATAANVDVLKPGIDNTISFDFKHALTSVSIEAIPFVDNAHSGDTHASTHNTYGKLSKGTVVTLRSVKFIGVDGTTLPSQGLLNLADGTWTVEGTDEGAYEMTTATEWDASSADVTLGESHLKKIATDKMLIPASESGSTVKVQVVYDVKTVDPSDPKNNSTITNTITSEGSYTLAKGTAYKFHLDLGLTSVKFTAKVTSWNTDNKEVDLPNNKYPGIAAVSYVSAASQPATCAQGDVYFNTTDSEYYEAEGTNSWSSAPLSTTELFYNSADGKYYTNSTFTAPSGGKAPADLAVGYYVIDNVLYKKA